MEKTCFMRYLTCMVASCTHMQILCKYRQDHNLLTRFKFYVPIHLLTKLNIKLLHKLSLMKKQGDKYLLNTTCTLLMLCSILVTWSLHTCLKCISSFIIDEKWDVTCIVLSRVIELSLQEGFQLLSFISHHVSHFAFS